MTKFFFIMFRGMALFKRFFASSFLSVLAITGLFLTLHIAFASGVSVTDFIQKFARFDRIRVYVSPDRLNNITNSIKAVDSVEKIKIYTQAESKQYIKDNAATVGGIDSLPDELFPVFIEVILTEENHSVESLKKTADILKEIPDVDFVSYGEGWAENMQTGKTAVLSLLMYAAVLFALVAALIVYQTVNVSMFKFKDEIKVYGIVGGTAFFITMPFVVMAMLLTFMCFIFSSIFYIIAHKIQLSAIESVTGLKMEANAVYFLIFFITAIIVSGISATISARLFLKNDKITNDE